MFIEFKLAGGTRAIGESLMLSVASITYVHKNSDETVDIVYEIGLTEYTFCPLEDYTTIKTRIADCMQVRYP